MKRETIWLWGASVILAVGATRIFWAAHTGEVMYDRNTGEAASLENLAHFSWFLATLCLCCLVGAVIVTIIWLRRRGVDRASSS